MKSEEIEIIYLTEEESEEFLEIVNDDDEWCEFHTKIEQLIKKHKEEMH